MIVYNKSKIVETTGVDTRHLTYPKNSLSTKRVFSGSEQLAEQRLLKSFRSEWRKRHSIFEKKLLGYLVKIENGWSDKKVY